MKLLKGKQKLKLNEKQKYKAHIIITEEHIKNDRWISCKELFENNICRCLKQVKNRKGENVYRCNAKNKQPIQSAYHIRPGWCPLFERKKNVNK